MSSLTGRRVVVRAQGYKGVVTLHSEDSEVVCVRYDEPVKEYSNGAEFQVAMRFYRLEEVKFV